MNKIYKILFLSLALLMGITIIGANNTSKKIEADQTNIDTSYGDNTSLEEDVLYEDDGSCLVFVDDKNFVWYLDGDYTNSNNYLLGDYELYKGEKAHNLFTGNDSYEGENPAYRGKERFLFLDITSSIKDGQEIKETTSLYLYGYQMDDGLYLYDTSTFEEYKFK